MNIRPLDLQVMLPRVTEVGKTQQISQHQTELQGQQTAKEWQQIAETRQHSVQQSDRPVGGHIQRDGNRQQPSYREHDSDETPAEKEEHSRSAQEDGSGKGKIIDIRT